MFSGLFSAAETALFSLGSLDLRRIAARTDIYSKLLVRFLRHPSRTLITILIGNMVVNTALSCAFTLYAAQVFGYEWLGVALAFFTIVLLLCGEIIPKTVAISHNVVLSYLIVLPLAFFSYLFAPGTYLITLITRGMFTAFHEKEGVRHAYTEEEMKTLLELGHESGAIGEGELESLSNLFSFGDRLVKEIMVPRTNMVAGNREDGREALAALVREKKARYAVVFDGTIDTVVGIVFARELFLHPQGGLKKIMRKPVYVPEVKKIDSLIEDMMTEKYDCVLCVDEHGGTAGIVSQEEVIEAIYGRLHDEEFEKQEEDVVVQPSGDVVVDGNISLYELNKLVEAAVDIEAEHYDSVGGFLLAHFEEIPAVGARLVYHDIEFIIAAVDKNRIERVRVRKGVRKNHD